MLSGTSVYPCRPDEVTLALSVCRQRARANDLTKVCSTAFGGCEAEDARAIAWLPISTGQGDGTGAMVGSDVRSDGSSR